MVSELRVRHVACLVSENSCTEFGSVLSKVACVTYHKVGEVAEFVWVSFYWGGLVLGMGYWGDFWEWVTCLFKVL
jgi:hypothetical protein